MNHPSYSNETFFKKPGKLGARNFDLWAESIMRKAKVTAKEAISRVHQMITTGILIQSEG